MAGYLSVRSVVVMTAHGSGSGTLFTRLDSEGKPVHLVWTAGHVVNTCRSVYTALDPEGHALQKTKWEPVNIVIPLVQDGRTVGSGNLIADVIQYSNYETGDDLAILKIRDSRFPGVKTDFWLRRSILPVGSEVSTVGSPLGLIGANTFSTGMINYIGRQIMGRVFDQTSTVVYGGSSGSGVFSSDGKYIGMLTMMTQPQMGYIIPVRRIQSWATRAHVMWAMDRNVPMPSAASLAILPIENDGTGIPRLLQLPPVRRDSCMPPDQEDED